MEGHAGEGPDGRVAKSHRSGASSLEAVDWGGGGDEGVIPAATSAFAQTLPPKEARGWKPASWTVVDTVANSGGARADREGSTRLEHRSWRSLHLHSKAHGAPASLAEGPRADDFASGECPAMAAGSVGGHGSRWACAPPRSRTWSEMPGDAVDGGTSAVETRDVTAAAQDAAYLYVLAHDAGLVGLLHAGGKLGDASREPMAEAEAVRPALVAGRYGAGMANRTDGAHDDLQRLKIVFDLLRRAVLAQHSRGRSLGRTSPVLRLCMGTARAGRALAGPRQEMLRAFSGSRLVFGAQGCQVWSGECMRIALVLGFLYRVLLC